MKQWRHLFAKAPWWSWEWSPCVFPAGVWAEASSAPCICSPQVEEEQSGDGKASLL